MNRLPDLSNVADRHLVLAYAAVWIIQLGYAAWVAWQWKRNPPTP